MIRRGCVVTIVKEDNGTRVYSFSPFGMESLDWLTNPTLLDDWVSWPSKSLYLPQINTAINWRTESPSPLCLKTRTTFPHMVLLLWSNWRIPTLVRGRPPVWVIGAFAVLVKQSPGCGWYWPSGDFQCCRPDGGQPCVDLGARCCQDRFPHCGIRGGHVKHTPYLWAPGFTQRDIIWFWQFCRSWYRL